MNKEEFQKGTVAYSHMKKILWRVFRRHGGKLHQDEFDRIFSDYGYKVRNKDGRTVRIPRIRKGRAIAYSTDSFILGDMTQTMWSKYLHLLRLAIAAGYGEIEGEKGGITYCLKSAP